MKLLKHTFRFISHKLFYASLNIVNLSIGIAAFILCISLVRFETSFDRYHKDYKQIYRLATAKNRVHKTDRFATAPVHYAPFIKESYPEVESFGRIGKTRPFQFKEGEKVYIETNIAYADTGFVKLFSLDIIQGNKDKILSAPYTCIISESTAKKYYGKQSPVNMQLHNDTSSFLIEGVFRDFPAQTHIRADIIISLSTQRESEFGRQHAWNLLSYIKLRKGTNAFDFEKKIAKVSKQVGPYNPGQPDEAEEEVITNFLQPVHKIHLNSKLLWEGGTNGNKSFVIIFLIIGTLILMIACINFINIHTSYCTYRFKEVLIKKTIGASRINLIKQFMGEVLIMTFLAHIIGMFLVESFLPGFNHLTGTSLTTDYTDPFLLLTICSIILIISLISGSYPAFYLSKFTPSQISRIYERPDSSGIIFRRVLMIIQFGIATVLLISFFIIRDQLNFLKTKDPGFELENTLIVDIPRGGLALQEIENFKNEFLALSFIKEASISTSIPGRWRYRWRMWPVDEDISSAISLNCFGVDYDYIEMYKINIIGGRGFDRSLSDSLNRGYIINEAAVDAYGWDNVKNALTKSINHKSRKVLGVIENYHFMGINQKIEPLAMFLTDEDFVYLSLHINPQYKQTEIRKAIKDIYTKRFADDVFNYYYLEDDFNNQYTLEDKLSKAFGILAGLGIFIAALGILGFVVFSVEQKTKETAIRKINGAKPADIYYLYLKSILINLFIAFVIASPVAYFALKTWLSNYPYRTGISPGSFATAAGISILIITLTTSFHLVKLSRINPADSIRHE